DNPLVTGEPHVRFYAGASLVNSKGLPMGTLCVIDHQPRELTESQLVTLQALARQIVGQLELRKTNIELRRAVTSLKGNNEDLKNFTAFAAHDLRSPLNRIIAYSSFLKDQEAGKLSSASASDLDRIQDSAKGMETLLSSMLDLCGVGQGELSDSSVALTDCANLAIEALQGPIREKKAQVCVDILPCVRGDMTLLTQVFHNLIENALKFSGEEAPRIDLTCIYEGSEPSVLVGDNGIGMERSQAERIFQPFKRAHENERIDGSGIGLAVVRKIIERHGGQIHVDSAPGEGAQFLFTLAGMRMPRTPQSRESLTANDVSFEGLGESASA
ncbi:MAG: ATP-binding protein, partial [Planctomycetota bacterium]